MVAVAVDPQIQILSERSHPGGLAFDARLSWDSGGRSAGDPERDSGGDVRRDAGRGAPRDSQERLLEVRLHWADYNLWSPDGGDAPERVAAAVLRFMAGRVPPEDFPEAFDAAVLRRRFEDADAAIARILRAGVVYGAERGP